MRRPQETWGSVPPAMSAISSSNRVPLTSTFVPVSAFWYSGEVVGAFSYWLKNSSGLSA
ncbi:MAG: hypothetical protein WDN04_04550 [Rhodospirillales bacterium]